MNNHQSAQEARELAARLAESQLFVQYREAFTRATNLPLDLVPADGSKLPFGECQTNAFCSLIRKGGCQSCSMADCCLLTKAGGETLTSRCFAGMLETAVPVRVGNAVIAYLRTGQQIPNAPTEAKFAQLEKWLREKGREKEIPQIKKAFLALKPADGERYESNVRLVEFFADQLAAHANRLLLEQHRPEPAPVRKAKRFVAENLGDRIALEDVAKHSGVSTFYFCKVFKASTGMCFTEYVNRVRVEKAKALLNHPEHRITEVAYAVGFQSLSQFNRSFQKYAGESPTEFRRRIRGEEAVAA